MNKNKVFSLFKDILSHNDNLFGRAWHIVMVNVQMLEGEFVILLMINLLETPPPPLYRYSAK